MSTPTATSAAQPPEITTTSPAGHTTPIQTEAPAQPSAATKAPTSNPTPTPSSVPTSTPAPAQNPANATSHLQTPSPNAAPVIQNVPTAQQEELTYNEKLNAADRLWKFKLALTIALILVGLIGIGCIAWAVDRANHLIEGLGYGYDSMWALPWGLITLSISIIWCVICIARFLSRKRPVHPGIRVTMDLLLWLGIIPTALLLMAVLYDVIYWGQDGTLGSYEGFSTSYGGYELQPNNTWTWVPDTDRYGSSVTYPRSCNYSSSVYSQYYNPNVPFHNCAELDAYVNALWQAKPNYARVILTGVVCQWIAVALHFALFVWACVDCHKKRRTKISNDAEKLAASIVQSMVQNGAIIPTSRQLQTRANGWQQAYEPLQSAPGSFSGQGGYAQPPYAQQGVYQGYQQPQMQMRGANGQQMYAPQMQGPNGPQMRQQQQRARPISGEQPLPPLPPRPQPAQQQQQEIAQPGPSSDKGKAPAAGEPAGSVAASYYEPGH